jgi:iron complex transport system ATP-binding protein
VTLAARALDYGYRGCAVGRALEVEVAPGEVTCLLGPNGSGKTTLLRTLLGVLRPLAGDVVLEGRPVASLGAQERARRVAYVPQAAESPFDFTVREMVAMGRTAYTPLFARPSRADAEATQEALERVGLADLAERPVGRVSGGERQLALIARALATHAGILLMDEPTANLDMGNQVRVLDEIARLRAGGKAILFTTHHPDHALRVADRAILLKAGAIVAQGPAASTLNSANLSALYGRPVAVVEVASDQGPPIRACVAR